METIIFSKATALFNFLSKSFKPTEEIGNWDLHDIAEIIEFIESEEFKKIGK